MVGSDEVTFKGTSMLTRDGKAMPETLLFYGGTLRDHAKVSLYTLLPDQSSNKQAAHGLKEVRSRASTSSMKPYYSQIVKKEGQWIVQSSGDLAQEGSSLDVLNPIQQLEALEKLGKSIREEAGAGRGTSVLRIELTPEEARGQLTAELEREMLRLRPETQLTSKSGTDGNLKVTEALTKLWERRNNELQEKLKDASVESIYHLTVDKKHNLPRRLTFNRKITYKGANNGSSTETYASQVDFSGYR